MIFAAGGMAGAPIGAQIHVLFEEAWLLICFAALMLVVAIRMWRSVRRLNTAARDRTKEKAAVSGLSRRIALLVATGIVAGILSGLFGVSGGFIIVPALMLADRRPIQKAIGTSLLVIALISVVGVGAHIAAGNAPDATMTVQFVLGGAIGLIPAWSLVQKLPAPALQKIFATVITALAVFIIMHSLAAA